MGLRALGNRTGRPIARTPIGEILVQDVQRLVSQGKDENRTRLALVDAQRARLPIDGVQRQTRHFRGSQTVIGHEVQNGVVAPTQIVAPVDRSQQLFNQIPAERAGWQLTTIGLGRIDAVKSARGLSAICAIAQKGAQARHFMLKRLAPNLTGCGLDEDFDMLGRKRSKDGPLVPETSPERSRSSPDAERSLSEPIPSHSEDIADIVAAAARHARSASILPAVLPPSGSGDTRAQWMRDADCREQEQTLPAIWLRSVSAHIEGSQRPRRRASGDRRDDASQHEDIPSPAATGRKPPVQRRSASFHNDGKTSETAPST